MKHTDELGNIIWAHHKPKRSPVESQNQNISAQDRAAQSAAYGNANATDANFAGPTQDTPYYKSLLATSTDATSNAYENAKASSASKAQAAGFGYTSPIGQAASRETENAEAGALASLPAQAYQATAPLQLQAANQQIQEGTALGSEGVQYQGQATNLEEEYQKRNSAFQNRLWDMGLSGVQKGAQLATGV